MPGLACETGESTRDIDFNFFLKIQISLEVQQKSVHKVSISVSIFIGQNLSGDLSFTFWLGKS